MNQHTHETKTEHGSRTLVLLFVLFALGLRAHYVPLHLAQHEHLGAGGLSATQLAEDADHADAVHGHRHGDELDAEQGGEHLPHPALDHTCELIAQRAPSQQRVLDLPALPLESGWSLATLAALPWSKQPEARTPERRPRPSPRPRGPPAAA